MVQQVSNGDGPAVCGKLRKDIRERVFVVQLAIVDQQHDGHGGELFAARSQTKTGLGVDLRHAVEIAHAIAPLVYHAAILANQDCQARRFRVGQGRENRADFCARRFRVVGRAAGLAGREESREKYGIY